MTGENPEIQYKIEPLGTRHDRAAFSCGVPALDIYLLRQARQDLDRNLAAVFILTLDSKTVAGFYTLSAHSIQAADLPEKWARKLPRFPLPVTLLGRMAVSQSLHGQRLGEFLLMDALKRAWLGSSQVASWAIVVDAKEGARDFYLKHDFAPLPSQPDRLILPMRTIERLFAS
ncbi:MAG TPA: GNAT family N-acetyltransferase [Acidobacteriaceae bacterium]|nr:GNAT family N-acetyltransferase [Acidobacteriaceae bacterium]